ncbi:hypothetical protein F4777DRAFT_562001 [Nemania sp. FL0916]|nr:hypothetical protein F4777DRAFT_562001 [Nemania sp. FL0916]
MTRALEHIRAEGTFPPPTADRPLNLRARLTAAQPFINSYQDGNSVGECTVTASAINDAKARVEAWLAPGEAGHAVFSPPPPPASSSTSPSADPSTAPTELKLCFIDGFLLYGPYPPLREVTDDLLDVKIFLTASQQKATARREARDGYVTLEGFWADPPGYVEKVVWPNYAASHAWLFEDGDVDRKVRSEVLREKDILALPQVTNTGATTAGDGGGKGGGKKGEGEKGEGLDIDMQVVFEWAVDTLMRKLEETAKK